MAVTENDEIDFRSSGGASSFERCLAVMSVQAGARVREPASIQTRSGSASIRSSGSALPRTAIVGATRSKLCKTEAMTHVTGMQDEAHIHAAKELDNWLQ